MSLKHCFVFVAILALAACASTQKKPAPTAQTTAPVATASTSTHASDISDLVKLSCARGTETRFLEVSQKGSGCALDYTKSGKMSAVATSAHGVKHCVDSQKKIRTKLEQAGFKCA